MAQIIEDFDNLNKDELIINPAEQFKLQVIDNENCFFCIQGKKKNFFGSMINEALYDKYSATQVYYYTSDINDILNHERSPAVENFKDMLIYDDVDEFLKRMYKRSEFKGKVQLLTEYYKYHNDIPRLFMKPQRDTMIKFHDAKRRIEFKELKKEIGADQFEVENKASIKGTGTDEESSSKSKSKLATLTQKEKWQKPLLLGLKFLQKDSVKFGKFLRGQQKTSKVVQQSFQERSTIHYLNQKLGDIINTSKILDQSRFSDISQNVTLTNLDNFQNFIKTNYHKIMRRNQYQNKQNKPSKIKNKISVSKREKSISIVPQIKGLKFPEHKQAKEVYKKSLKQMKKGEIKKNPTNKKELIKFNKNFINNASSDIVQQLAGVYNKLQKTQQQPEIPVTKIKIKGNQQYNQRKISIKTQINHQQLNKQLIKTQAKTKVIVKNKINFKQIDKNSFKKQNQNSFKKQNQNSFKKTNDSRSRAKTERLRSKIKFPKRESAKFSLQNQKQNMYLTKKSNMKRKLQVKTPRSQYPQTQRYSKSPRVQKFEKLYQKSLQDSREGRKQRMLKSRQSNSKESFSTNSKRSFSKTNPKYLKKSSGSQTTRARSNTIKRGFQKQSNRKQDKHKRQLTQNPSNYQQNNSKINNFFGKQNQQINLKNISKYPNTTKNTKRQIKTHLLKLDYKDQQILQLDLKSKKRKHRTKSQTTRHKNQQNIKLTEYRYRRQLSVNSNKFTSENQNRQENRKIKINKNVKNKNRSNYKNKPKLNLNYQYPMGQYGSTTPITNMLNPDNKFFTYNNNNIINVFLNNQNKSKTTKDELYEKIQALNLIKEKDIKNSKIPSVFELKNYKKKKSINKKRSKSYKKQ